MNVIFTIGDTIYMGGDFNSVYNGKGTERTRNYLAAFDRLTGKPTSFQPVMNNKVFTITASPDESTLYVGGSFTEVNGKTRKRVAAFDVESGELTSFQAPAPNGGLRALGTDGTTLYMGGLFDKIDGIDVGYLAAVDIATETLDTSWMPNASARVTSLIVDPDRIWLGGDFSRINGVRAKNLATVDPEDGSLQESDHVVYPVIDLAASGNQVFVAGGGPGGRGAAFNRTTGKEQWMIESDGNFQGVDAIGKWVYFGGHYENLEPRPNNGTRTLVGRMTRHDKVTGELDTGWLPLVNGLRSVNTVVADRNNLYIGGDFTYVSRTRHEGFAMFTGNTR